LYVSDVGSCIIFIVDWGIEGKISCYIGDSWVLGWSWSFDGYNYKFIVYIEGGIFKGDN
jgi:hypothetical protein